MRAPTRVCFLLTTLLLTGMASRAAAQLRPVDDSRLERAGETGEDWLSYGLTPEETRYSPLNQITAENVGRLGLAWSYDDVGPGGGNQEGTLLEADNVIYGITNWSVVYAIDATDGEELWRWDPEVNQTTVRSRICCGVVNRGLALYDDMVIAPVIDGRLHALDRETGRPVWEARVSYAQDNYTITIAPRIADGKVIVGVAGAEYPVRGFFDAYDARTGERVWRFWTTPGNPALGFENAAMEFAATTWAGEWWRYGGGATVWDAISYDPEAGLVYVGTGNGGPWPESLRQSQGLDNLFIGSIVAVDVDTGELVWYYQPVPGDSWDYDSVQHLLLADLTIDGRERKVIMQANKNGFYYVIDRVSGAFISAEPFSYITWAAGIDQETGRPIINPEAHYDWTGQAAEIAPGPGGAHNWSPMAFSPDTGLIYLPASTSGSIVLEVDPDWEFQPGQSNTGRLRRGRGGAIEGTDAEPAPDPVVPPAIGPEPEEGIRGVLLAWDPVTQTERWRSNEGGGSIGGGALSTAGNLVFQVVNDGRLLAFTADTGEKLLEIDTGLAGGMGPPITYLVDGVQYVSVVGGQGGGGGGGRGGAGRGGAEGGGRGANLPGPAEDAPGNPTPKVLTFVLDGTETIPDAQ